MAGPRNPPRPDLGAPEGRQLAALGGPLRELNAWPRPVALAVVGTALYVGLALFADSFAVTADGDLVIWYPPAGLALGLLLLGGVRMAPAVFAGELIAGLVAFDALERFTWPQLAASAAVITVAYTAAALLTHRLVRRQDGGIALSVAIPIVAGVGVGATGAAILGTSVRAWADEVGSGGFLDAVGLWLVGDAVGVLTLTPAVVLITLALTGRVPGWSGRYLVLPVLVALAAVVPAIVILTTGGRFQYLAVLPVVLAGMYRGLRGSTLAVLVANASVSFAAEIEGSTVGRVDIQVLLAVIGVTGLVVGALASERRWALLESRELAAIVETMPQMVAAVGRDGHAAYVNPAGRELVGLPPDADAAELRVEDLFERSGAYMTLRTWRGGALPVNRHDIPANLARGLPRRIVIAEDITERARLEEELRLRALQDTLTGLANRGMLAEHLRIALARAARRPTSHGIVFIDLDRFKVVNDSLGHAAGDALLIAVGRRLSDAVRRGDLVARLGGDEFAIVLADCDPDEAQGLLERLLASLRGSYTLGGRSVTVTASAGLAIITGGDCTPDEALRRADIAMYTAKRRGGDQLAMFDPLLGTGANRRLGLESDLRAALQDGSWYLAYQPVTSLRSGQMIAAEALFRWERPGEGLIEAREAIALAEEIGEIARLGGQVLHRACAAARSWEGRASRAFVAVNTSALQLVNPSFVDDVASALECSGLTPHRLVLEVTESALIERGSAAITTLAAVRELGVRVALDDFGTGFASLAAIADLAVDIIKMDQLFVSQIGVSQRGEDLVAGVIDLANRLGLLTLGEGVETERQMETLRALGCRMAQGYHIARPLPPQEISGFAEPPAHAGAAGLGRRPERALRTGQACGG